jgi:hypothetical protein
MAPVRVRGCAARVSIRRDSHRQAEASRRQNGPRKATANAQRSSPLITERLSSKSCPAEGHDGLLLREKVRVAQAATPQQASVGSKTRSDGRVPCPQHTKGMPVFFGHAP